MAATIDNRPLVETFMVENRAIEPKITGYGKVRPKETWDAVAQVSGRVVYRHPELERGKMLRKGTELIRIDPLDYQLKLAQAKSDLTSAKAELDKIELNGDKLVNALGIERRRLAIMEKELTRKTNLNKTGAVSSSVLEQEKQNVLAQEQKVLDLDTNLKLVPNNLEVAKAAIQVAESRVQEAKRKLENTHVVMPFDGKVAEVKIERDQVVSEREIMVKAHRWDRMEIATQVSLSDMRGLIAHTERSALVAGQVADIANLDLKADVILYVGDHKMHWDAVVTRVGESIDPQGNSVVLMVEVEQNAHVDPSLRPPLINEMYVEVVVSGGANSQLVVPAQALRGEMVYLMDEKGQLDKRPVDVGLIMEPWAIIDNGLSVGDKVVINDVIPAVTGMKLREIPASVEGQE